MEREGRVPLRFHASSYLNSPNAKSADKARAVLGMCRDFASDLIDIHTIKISNDGTIEGKTAAVLKPYAAGGKQSRATVGRTVLAVSLRSSQSES